MYLKNDFQQFINDNISLKINWHIIEMVFSLYFLEQVQAR